MARSKRKGVMTINVSCYPKNKDYLRTLCRTVEDLESDEDKDNVLNYVIKLVEKRTKEAKIKALEEAIAKLRGN